MEIKDNKCPTYFNEMKLFADMKFKKLFPFFLLSVIWIFSVVDICFAQKYDYKFNNLTNSDGLSQSSGYSILEDKYGFIWIGTSDGLNRYDGKSFVVFKNNKRDKNSISNNLIFSLCEDRNGNIWVGTQYGLNKIEFNSEGKYIFRRFLYDPENKNSICGNDVRNIIEDSNGILWIGTFGDGLSRYDPKTELFTTYAHDEKNNSSISNNYIWKILEDKEGLLWICTFAGGLNCFDRTNNTFRNFKHNAKDPQSISLNNVQCMMEDHLGNLWFGTYGGGLNYLTKNSKISGKFIHLSFDGELKTSKDLILSIFEDSQHRVWVGTENNALKMKPLKSESDISDGSKFLTYRNDPNNFFSIASNQIWTVMEDRNNNLWFGATANGISRLNKSTKKFETFTNNVANKSSLSNNSVWAITEDDDGTLWIGTERELNRLEKNSDSFQVYHNIIQGNINALYFDETRKVLIIGSQGSNLIELNKRNGAVSESTQDPENIFINSFKNIYKDSFGLLWYGTVGNGITLVDLQKNKRTNYKSERGNPNSLSSNSVIDIREDKNHNVWIGTENGLNLYVRETNRFIRLKQNLNDSTGLSSDFIPCVYIDAENVIWLGTLGGGLNKLKYDLKESKQEIKYFTVENGLANNVVYSILEDDHNNLWMGTNNGISKFNKKTETFRNYDYKDGLQSNEFNVGAYFKGRDGYMYFGGINGLTKFHPDSIKDNTHIPPVLLTSFKVYKEEIKIPKPIFLTDTVTLNYDDRIISIEFAALDYNTPEKNQFSYFLEEFDREWNYNGNRNFTSYTNLDPGSYKFRVRASNNDGLWNETGKTLTIIINPPFWLTWWFKALVVVAVILSAYTFSVLRTKRILEKQKEIEEIVISRLIVEKENLEDVVLIRTYQLKEHSDKIEIANEQLRKANELKTELLNLTVHDLKNPLTSISYCATAIEESPDDSAIVSKKAKSILSITSRVLTLINNMLRKNELETGEIILEKSKFDLKELISIAVESFALMASGKNIRVEFSDDHSDFSIYADYERLREVFDNLLSNAIKFSPAGKKIKVALSHTAENNFSISFKDQGPGFSSQDKEKLFGKFQRLSAQPTGGESSTGLGLSIVKQLVELHNGKITVISDKGDGAEFIIVLPV